ncbi:hypothetical protein ACR9VJ_26275 [Streptomyces sp. H49]|uniref:hypothetical protein n=1 Tax=Streptomyces sp. H49 TaxID=3444117 RepID=UPI003F4AE1EF
MIYRLKYNPGVEAIQDSLPQATSEAMTIALDSACHDPYGATEPYGEDDGVTRILRTEHAYAILMIGHKYQEVVVLDLIYHG